LHWPATTRYGLEPAPGSLALVQDFLNTIPAGRPRGTDLLAELPAAQEWLDGALVAWAATRALPVGCVVLAEADLGKLRRLRARLIDVIRAGEGGAAQGDRPLAASATTTLRLGADGAIEVLPFGQGGQHLISHLLMEMYDAQLRDTWRRLKTCSDPRCAAAFFDRSRNNSRIWHDVGVCGNAANLRAHRARRLAQEGPT